MKEAFHNAKKKKKKIRRGKKQDLLATLPFAIFIFINTQSMFAQLIKTQRTRHFLPIFPACRKSRASQGPSGS